MNTENEHRGLGPQQISKRQYIEIKKKSQHRNDVQGTFDSKSKEKEGDQ